jgi:hypothetical protein
MAEVSPTMAPTTGPSVGRYKTPDAQRFATRESAFAKDAMPNVKRRRVVEERSSFALQECQVCRRKCMPLKKYQRGEFCSVECYVFI